ncbi:class I SAM-dependent methyltransferase [Kitasatospora sp. NBC_00240]|uniref:methyltransferase domain-containing protein n=1 Tax=Kitasatospora sp. NBC_00240 TaxID=2903567 RepID=UPI002251159C|nr:methyltransferase domain-containing protein [Kitasatospora sp. NBC_00240]MCX5213761.1 class I SAM-dependent methyltransferase [Kitasatospora sp. NBC_00240]
MAGIAYDRQTAEDYRIAREVPRAGLDAWRAAIADEAALAPGGTVLDVGAGTGAFAAAFHDWFGVRVLAVDPAEAMRAMIPRTDGITVLDGRADALPVPDGCADAAWLGSVVHHLPDLAAAAAELRRALKPGAPVLIRNIFPGRADRDLRVRFFPETERLIEGYPTVEQVCAAFATAGFTRTALRAVPQESAADLDAFTARIRRDADSKLRGLTDEEFERGMARLRATAAAAPGHPATSWMDLLVLS